MDIGKTQQNVAAGTRISGRARGSAPRSRVKHVEVLVKIRQLALLILGDLDPYPPNLTRRALPPPDVRRAIILIISGVLEAVWATALGKSEGLTKLWPSVVFFGGLALSMVGLA